MYFFVKTKYYYKGVSLYILIKITCENRIRWFVVSFFWCHEQTISTENSTLNDNELVISDLGMAVRIHPAIRVANEMSLTMVNFSRKNKTPMIMTKSGLEFIMAFVFPREESFSAEK